MTTEDVLDTALGTVLCAITTPLWLPISIAVAVIDHLYRDAFDDALESNIAAADRNAEVRSQPTGPDRHRSPAAA